MCTSLVSEMTRCKKNSACMDHARVSRGQILKHLVPRRATSKKNIRAMGDLRRGRRGRLTSITIIHSLIRSNFICN